MAKAVTSITSPRPNEVRSLRSAGSVQFVVPSSSRFGVGDGSSLPSNAAATSSVNVLPGHGRSIERVLRKSQSLQTLGVLKDSNLSKRSGNMASARFVVDPGSIRSSVVNGLTHSASARVLSAQTVLSRVPSVPALPSTSVTLLPKRDSSPVRGSGIKLEGLLVRASSPRRNSLPLGTTPSHDSSPLRRKLASSSLLPGVATVPMPISEPQRASSSVSAKPTGSLRNLCSGKFSWLPLEVEAPISKACEQFLQGSSCNILELFGSRYELTGTLLGMGKHSQVIQVEDKSDHCIYAAKVIAVNSTSEDKIRREAAAMTLIQHRNSTQLVDVLQCREQLPGITARPPYVLFVMKQLAGEPLSGEIIRKGPNPALANRLLSQISEVLATMHRHRCVHRDVWSENILVDPRSLNMYLIDFGCAEMCDKPSDFSALDKLNIPYLAPSADRFNPRPSDDMWSLGLVLTEVVTGKPVSFRMGRTDTPFYYKKELLQNALTETFSHGGPFLGRIAMGLLAIAEGDRLRADDVIGICQGNAGSLTAAVAPVARTISSPRNSHSQLSVSTPSGGPTTSVNLQNGSTPRHVLSSSGGTARFGPSRVVPKQPITRKLSRDDTMSQMKRELSPGQNVIYEATTHKASYAGTIVGRSPGADGWLIELLVGGVKEVKDAESWRLTPN